MKKAVVFLLIFLLMGCSKYDNLNIGYSTNIIDEDLKNILNDYKLSNTDKFINLLNDFNLEDDENCGIKNWEISSSFNYDDNACYDRYEKNHEQSDGNCRITSFMLLEDLISTSKEKDISGSYLMFDLDVIESNKEYEFLKNNINKFITLFDEMDVSNVDEKEYKNVFINKWNEYNIKVNSDKVSLISVVMNDNIFEDLLFIGHAGVLINLDDKYLFIEKIAFEEPYQFTIIKEKNDLVDLFKTRKSYFADGSEEGPFIYENNELLYEFK